MVLKNNSQNIWVREIENTVIHFPQMENKVLSSSSEDYYSDEFVEEEEEEHYVHVPVKPTHKIFYPPHLRKQSYSLSYNWDVPEPNKNEYSIENLLNRK